MDLKILQIASNTENNKIIKNHTHNAKFKNPICGDEIEISLNIKEEKILDFGYQCKSCVYCQASVSLLSRNTINKSIINLSSDSIFSKKYISTTKINAKKQIMIVNHILENKRQNTRYILNGIANPI